MAADDRAEGVVIGHTVLVGLSAIIPIPLLDMVAKRYVLRRLVRELAEAHGATLSERQIEVIADDPADKLAGDMFKGALLKVALYPLKFVLRKAFAVLAVKGLIDLASQTYHFAWLVETALMRRWVPEKKTASQLRAAVDAVIAAEPVASSPVTNALRKGFSASRRALDDVGQSLRARLADLIDGDAERAAERAMDDAGREEPMQSVIDQIRSALTEVPSEHFDELERKLRESLGVAEED